MAGEFIKIDISAQSKQVLKNLEHTDLMPILRKEMRAATSGIAPIVRAEARNLPSSRTGRRQAGTSLRRSVANIIRMKLRINPREIMIAIVAVPHGGKSNLARSLEGTIPWKVKVFGREGTEHDQKPEPFFYPTIEKLIPGVTAKVESVLNKYASRI